MRQTLKPPLSVEFSESSVTVRHHSQFTNSPKSKLAIMASWVASFLGSVSSLWTSSGEAKHPQENGKESSPEPAGSLECSPITEGRGPPGARHVIVDTNTGPLERKPAARQVPLRASAPSTKQAKRSGFPVSQIPPTDRSTEESRVPREYGTVESSNQSASGLGAVSVRLEPLPREVEAAM
jgi:hypothetical protein